MHNINDSYSYGPSCWMQSLFRKPESCWNVSCSCKANTFISKGCYSTQPRLLEVNREKPKADRFNRAQARSVFLARKGAIIGIPTNNTRIHHSHGNITQSDTVHISRGWSSVCNQFDVGVGLTIQMAESSINQTELDSPVKGNATSNEA